MIAGEQTIPVNDESDNEEDNVGPSETVGVRWNADANRWVPDCGASGCIIPEKCTEGCEAWALRRDALDDVQDDPCSGNRMKNVNGFWVMAPAIPKVCNRCDCPLPVVQSSEACRFQYELTLHTRSGPCVRNVYSANCELCEAWTPWLPQHEHIHTIRNGRVGGEYTVVNRTAKCLPVCAYFVCSGI